MEKPVQSDILLVAINARYSHAALGLRYLLANMGSLRSRCALMEFVIQDGTRKMVEQILRAKPVIVGFSLAIWNIEAASRVIRMLKSLAPETRIVTGGPEVRWADTPPTGADHLIRGEGETAFPKLCRRLLAGETPEPVLDGGLPDLDEIRLPFDEYSEDDIRQRIISVETSRGCPFGCEFCLSSREISVRRFDLNRMLEAFDGLLARGCRGFKFIDRTFNLNLDSCRTLLDFFYERWPRNRDGSLIAPKISRQVGQGSDRGESLFLHFEVVPDRFDESLADSLSRFPAGGIQLEMGIQTLDPVVGERIGRKVDALTVARNLKLLRSRTGVHIHADLIMGLPGEDVEGIADSFDRLRAMGPHEIQMGILKLLPGAPIVRHSRDYGMKYSPWPPYEVLETDRIGFPEMQELSRFARYLDVFYNSGKFVSSMSRLMDSEKSAFAAFNRFSRWIWDSTGQEHAMSQARQYALVLGYLTAELNLPEEEAGGLLTDDYLTIGSRRYLPEILRPFSRDQ